MIVIIIYFYYANISSKVFYDFSCTANISKYKLNILKMNVL